MGTLSEKAKERVSGAAWDAIRHSFEEISDELLRVAPETHGDLTTIYIKYTLTSAASSPVYAVVWVKSSKKLVVGLALPDADKEGFLGTAPKGMSYKGLTGYFSITVGEDVPNQLRDWAQRAFQHVKSQD